MGRSLRRLIALAAGLAAVLAASSCDAPAPIAGGAGASGGSDPAASRGPATARPSSLERVPVTLAGPVTAMTPMADGALIVGTYDQSARPRAGLVRVDPTRPAASRTIATVPVSPYAFQGSWRLLGSDAGRLLGVAGGVGGAHGNVRWTVWRGDATRVAEEEQTFETFGGHEMGGLTGAGYLGGEPVLAGAWTSASAGLDIATWHASGTTWARDRSAGTALAADRTRLPSAVALVRGDGFALLVGSSTLLGPGRVTSVPTVWSAPDREGTPVWSRHELPTAGGDAEGSVVGRVEAGACPAAGAQGAPVPASAGCVLAGRVGANLRIWLWQNETARLVAATPDVPLADGDHIIGAGIVGTKTWVAIARAAGAGASGLILHTQDALNGAVSWDLQSAPDAGIGVAVAAGGYFWVTTDGAAGPALWRGR